MQVDLEELDVFANDLEAHESANLGKLIREAIAEIEAHRAQNVGGDEGLREALRKATEELEEIVSFTREERCCLRAQEIASIEEVAQASRSALNVATSVRPQTL